MDSNLSPNSGGVTSVQLTRLQGLSAPVVASAIELCDVRLPNTGFSDASVRSMFEDLPPIAGFAATLKIRTATPPMEGGRYSYARTDWWNHLLSIPAPRVLLIQDTDKKPGLGAFVGEVYACILRSLGCVGAITNGAVRDLREVRAAAFQVFAGNVSVSHAYAHVFDFGVPVEIAGLRIRPGELIHGDQHGFQTIPLDVLDQALDAADRILDVRNSLTSLCRSPEFSLSKLSEAVRETAKINIQPQKKTG